MLKIEVQTWSPPPPTAAARFMAEYFALAAALAAAYSLSVICSPPSPSPPQPPPHSRRQVARTQAATPSRSCLRHLQRRWFHLRSPHRRTMKRFVSWSCISWSCSVAGSTYACRPSDRARPTCACSCWLLIIYALVILKRTPWIPFARTYGTGPGPTRQDRRARHGASEAHCRGAAEQGLPRRVRLEVQDRAGRGACHRANPCRPSTIIYGACHRANQAAAWREEGAWRAGSLPQGEPGWRRRPR